MPAIIFVMITSDLQYKYNGYNADYYLVIAFGDAITGVFAYCILAFYFIKYKKLYKMNKVTQNTKEIRLEEQNNEVRMSMMH